MTENEIGTRIAQDAGVVECDQWRPFIAGASMMKGDCGHKSCVPRGLLHTYTTSLDAIRAAAMERFKTQEEIETFSDELFNRCLVKDGCGHRKTRKRWQLTALDWCEAYLRAVGMWEGGK